MLSMSRTGAAGHADFPPRTRTPAGTEPAALVDLYAIRLRRSSEVREPASSACSRMVHGVVRVVVGFVAPAAKGATTRSASGSPRGSGRLIAAIGPPAPPSNASAHPSRNPIPAIPFWPTDPRRFSHQPSRRAPLILCASRSPARLDLASDRRPRPAAHPCIVIPATGSAGPPSAPCWGGGCQIALATRAART